MKDLHPLEQQVEIAIRRHRLIVAGERILVFTGAMDYWANVDAVTWFVRQVFPEIRKRIRPVRFFIPEAV